MLNFATALVAAVADGLEQDPRPVVQVARLDPVRALLGDDTHVVERDGLLGDVAQPLVDLQRLLRVGRLLDLAVLGQGGIQD